MSVCLGDPGRVMGGKGSGRWIDGSPLPIFQVARIRQDRISLTMIRPIVSKRMDSIATSPWVRRASTAVSRE